MTIDKETSDKIAFIAFIIPQFAAAYKMNVQKAYRYLKQYGGLDFLFEHWWTLHTEDTYWSLRSLYNICYQNGGLK
ncbi:MAG: DUF3791 domain-containing protein [Bacteroidales bacterium]|jgi:hypothetical protein|nr:DUF3791 domain-containing protein [Bacteroidales bacterium]